MAITFALLLGAALLLGMLIFRSRCCSCPSPSATLGPFAQAEAPGGSPAALPTPSTKAPVSPHPLATPAPAVSEENSTEALWAPEVVLGP